MQDVCGEKDSLGVQMEEGKGKAEVCSRPWCFSIYPRVRQSPDLCGMKHTAVYLSPFLHRSQSAIPVSSITKYWLPYLCRTTSKALVGASTISLISSPVAPRCLHPLTRSLSLSLSLSLSPSLTHTHTHSNTLTCIWQTFIYMPLPYNY